MKAYTDILKNIIDTGVWKDTRTGIRCLTTFGQVFRHNMEEGFPLLTQRRIPFKSLCVELEGFLNGVTDKQWYQERGCKYWMSWSNPEAAKKHFDMCNAKSGMEPAVWNEENKKIAMLKTNDLGPIYGYQYRKFNKTYTVNDCQNEDDGDYNNYVDQIQTILDTLKTNPDDRRMVVSAWNPNQMHMMALPPCHFAFNLVHIDGKLNLVWHQRSVDTFLGLPSNIASYALLLLLFCRHSGLKPGTLMGTLADCHLYENHMDQAKTLLEREAHPLPRIKLTNEDFWDWDHTKVELLDYKHGPKLTAEVAV